MCIASQLYILWYGYDMLRMNVVEVGLCLLFFLFSFCLSAMNSARTDTLQHCCFPRTLLEPTCYNIAAFHFFFHHLLPHTSLHPYFTKITFIFSHPGQHGDHLYSDKPVVLGVFTSQTLPVFHSY